MRKVAVLATAVGTFLIVGVALASHSWTGGSPSAIGGPSPRTDLNVANLPNVADIDCGAGAGLCDEGEINSGLTSALNARLGSLRTWAGQVQQSIVALEDAVSNLQGNGGNDFHYHDVCVQPDSGNMKMMTGGSPSHSDKDSCSEGVVIEVAVQNH